MNSMPKIRNTVIIGAGPVGIAAAAQLLARGIKPVVLEQGDRAGHAMAKWGHVRVFTPWRYVTDSSVVKLLENDGWVHPDRNHLPTGMEIVEQYLSPASNAPQIRDNILYGATVVGVSKNGLSKSSTMDRDTTPFTIHYRTRSGDHRVIEAESVIDASGTWDNPNPIGADGLPVVGEYEFRDHIAYGIPDIRGKDRALYEGRQTLVLGGGHSAINVVLDLVRLRDETARTGLIWGLRRNNIEKLLGGGINDQLPARGALGIAAKKAISDGAVQLLAPMAVRRISKENDRLRVEIEVEATPRAIAVDRIVVAAGFRPDLDILREVRLDLDDVVEAPSALSPLIDPNLHSCGTVPPHGVKELAHPDRGFFIAGMKAYGRAPTFLMKTGYEQVRSIADELAGNFEAARRIELDLPETGLCITRPQTSEDGAALSVPADDGGCGAKALAERNARCCGPSQAAQE